MSRYYFAQPPFFFQWTGDIPGLRYTGLTISGLMYTGLYIVVSLNGKQIWTLLTSNNMYLRWKDLFRSYGGDVQLRKSSPLDVVWGEWNCKSTHWWVWNGQLWPHPHLLVISNNRTAVTATMVSAIAIDVWFEILCIWEPVIGIGIHPDWILTLADVICVLVLIVLDTDGVSLLPAENSWLLGTILKITAVPLNCIPKE